MIEQIIWDDELNRISSAEAFQVVSENLYILKIFEKFGYKDNKKQTFYDDLRLIDGRRRYCVRAMKSENILLYRPPEKILKLKKGRRYYEIIETNVEILKLKESLQNLRDARKI